MTQMMLFDAPAAPLFSAPVVTASASPAVLDSTSVMDSAMDSIEEAQIESSAKQTEDGLHRMGDLARLVLLRYELMAKRRARRAQRA